MNGDTLHVISTVIGSINLAVLIGFAVKWGRILEKVDRNRSDINGIAKLFRDHMKKYHERPATHDDKPKADD